jgi:DNA-binding CsgD family transcriptional regulator
VRRAVLEFLPGAPEPPVVAPTSALSPREVEVLRLVAGGRSDREIARRLGLSPHTVHRHLANIRTKLGLPSRAAATAYAARHHLLEP